MLSTGGCGTTGGAALRLDQPAASNPATAPPPASAAIVHHLLRWRGGACAVAGTGAAGAASRDADVGVRASSGDGEGGVRVGFRDGGSGGDAAFRDADTGVRATAAPLPVSAMYWNETVPARACSFDAKIRI